MLFPAAINSYKSSEFVHKYVLPTVFPSAELRKPLYTVVKVGGAIRKFTSTNALVPLERRLANTSYIPPGGKMIVVWNADIVIDPAP